MTGPGDIATAGAALRCGQTTAVELAERALAAAGDRDRSLGAFAALTPERALRDAARADGELRAGLDRGPLHGLPVSVKDVIDVAGAPTRLGTPGAGHRVPDADAVVVDALARAGAIVIGKAATHELALGMVTPGVANPFDRARMVGGSSGGSAAGVAAGLVVGSLGTDTAGSVRCPAALCGVVGLKPTFGALDTTGVARLAVSQDTVGALAATAADCAALWAALRHGPSPALVLATGYGRVGLDRGVLAERCDASVAAAVTAAAQALAATGIEIVDVEVQHLALASAVSLVVLLAEAGEAWGEALDRDGGAFGPAVRAALHAGRGIPAPDLERARKAALLVRAAFEALLDDRGLDAVLLPTVPVTAAPAGEAATQIGGRSVPVEAAHSRFTTLASVTGLPAISVPCGLDGAGLPIGLQALGRSGSEEALLRLAGALERFDGAVAVATARRKLRAVPPERTLA